jgi:hypothetical protein
VANREQPKREQISDIKKEIKNAEPNLLKGVISGKFLAGNSIFCPEASAHGHNTMWL